MCGDGRGYWGDFNELQYVGTTSGNTPVPKFLMAFTDSSKGCTEQWAFTSDQVHVSAVVIT